ncbi:Uncharacterised protein [Vibrio cholerae]|nr:Uncharacterised protein [Vibrio cholerae]CSD35540.1 Uncharacterised protein [Vibrio cholerae]
MFPGLFQQHFVHLINFSANDYLKLPRIGKAALYHAQRFQTRLVSLLWLIQHKA